MCDPASDLILHFEHVPEPEVMLLGKGHALRGRIEQL